MTNVLTAANILAAKDLETKTVPVPEWGGSVIITVMTAAARDEYDAFLYKNSEKKVMGDNLRAYYLSLCLVDENGKRLFSKDQIKELGEKSSKILNRLFEEASRLNALGVEAMEDVAKN